MTVAAVRVRGTVDVHPKIRDTLRSLRLSRPNHCVLLPEDDSTQGMLEAAKDYITWGEVDAGTIAELLSARGQLEGGDPITDDHVAEHTDHGSIEDLASAIESGEVRVRDVPEVKRVFRLHPPRSGYEGTKRSYRTGGALGYRGDEIVDLLDRMV